MQPRQQYKTGGGYIIGLYKHQLLPPTEGGAIRCKAIYVDDRNINDTNIEVVIMTWSPPHSLAESKEHYFALPATEQWGSQGWSFTNLEAAENKYNSIKTNKDE